MAKLSHLAMIACLWCQVPGCCDGEVAYEAKMLYPGIEACRDQQPGGGFTNLDVKVISNSTSKPTLAPTPSPSVPSPTGSKPSDSDSDSSSTTPFPTPVPTVTVDPSGNQTVVVGTSLSFTGLEVSNGPGNPCMKSQTQFRSIPEQEALTNLMRVPGTHAAIPVAHRISNANRLFVSTMLRLTDGRIRDLCRWTARLALLVPSPTCVAPDAFVVLVLPVLAFW